MSKKKKKKNKTREGTQNENEAPRHRCFMSASIEIKASGVL